MDNIINIEPNEIIEKKEDLNIVELAGELLQEARTDLVEKECFSIPIAELSTLGAGVSSLMPAFRTVTETSTINVKGLYELANQGAGDVLKAAKDGTKWGAFKTADGGSKFAKLVEASPVSVTNTTTVPIDPATMMMAAALYSVEQKLGDVIEMEKQILSFLEHEKEAEIEADVEMLMDLICKYKLNWENELFVQNNHKVAIDIERTARKNMIKYQKDIESVLEDKQFIVSNTQVKEKLAALEKNFKYYRLSVYNFSLATMLEVMLSGNFKEENILERKKEIEKHSLAYREIYTEASKLLGKLGKKSIERNVVKGIGKAGKLTGEAIGKVPVLKKTALDEMLTDGGQALNKVSHKLEKKAVNTFAEMADPATGVFLEKMGDMALIFNHTERLCFDEEKIYLVAGK